MGIRHFSSLINLLTAVFSDLVSAQPELWTQELTQLFGPAILHPEDLTEEDLTEDEAAEGENGQERPAKKARGAKK